jgi:hypothetical protein
VTEDGTGKNIFLKNDIFFVRVASKKGIISQYRRSKVVGGDVVFTQGFSKLDRKQQVISPPSAI